MSKLVEELKKDHVEIVATLDKVKALGIATKEGRETLVAAKARLLAHLKKEDERLYPALTKAAETDPLLKATLGTLAEEMKAVSAQALAFFAKYSAGGEGMQFAMDCGTLFGVLGRRIRQEEQLLYPEYDRRNP